MKLEVGKIYRTVCGAHVLITGIDEGARYPVSGRYVLGGCEDNWASSGKLYNDSDSSFDLVEEVVSDQPPVVSNACLLPEDSSARKGIPVTTGVLDYFPLAIAAVAELSKLGNDKHNPGEPLHWARGKSTDHADCIGRHLIDRGRFAEDGTRHTAALAWRALALLQEELEAERGCGPVSR